MASSGCFSLTSAEFYTLDFCANQMTKKPTCHCHRHNNRLAATSKATVRFAITGKREMQFSMDLIALIVPSRREQTVESIVQQLLLPAYGTEEVTRRMLGNRICDFTREAATKAAFGGCGQLLLSIEVKHDVIRRPAASPASGACSAVEMGSVCSVCMEEFSFDDGEEVTVVSCSHAFHKKCIGCWMERKRSCPICRADIPL